MTDQLPPDAAQVRPDPTVDDPPSSRDTESEQVIHAAYIDWVRARPFDLKIVREEGIENFGQFVLRQLDRVGLEVTRKRVPDAPVNSGKHHGQEPSDD